MPASHKSSGIYFPIEVPNVCLVSNLPEHYPNNSCLYVSFPGSCPDPFISVSGGFYQFLGTEVDATWEAARISCQESGGNLAVIDDCSVMTDIISYIEGTGQPKENLNGMFMYKYTDVK